MSSYYLTKKFSRNIWHSTLSANAIIFSSRPIQLTYFCFVLLSLSRSPHLQKCFTLFFLVENKPKLHFSSFFSSADISVKAIALMLLQLGMLLSPQTQRHTHTRTASHAITFIKNKTQNTSPTLRRTTPIVWSQNSFAAFLLVFLSFAFPSLFRLALCGSSWFARAATTTRRQQTTSEKLVSVLFLAFLLSIGSFSGAAAAVHTNTHALNDAQFVHLCKMRKSTWQPSQREQ